MAYSIKSILAEHYFGKIQTIRNRATRSLGDNSGFSLIDIVIAIMLLGILAMIIWPQYQSVMTQTKLNQAAGEMISALEYALALAVSYQRPFAVYTDSANNSYKVFDYQYKTDAAAHHDKDPPGDAYGVVLNPFNKAWYEKDFDLQDTDQGITIISGGEICFYPDSHSSESSQSIVLGFAGEQRTVTVNGATGRITAQ